MKLAPMKLAHMKLASREVAHRSRKAVHTLVVRHHTSHEGTIAHQNAPVIPESSEFASAACASIRRARLDGEGGRHEANATSAVREVRTHATASPKQVRCPATDRT